MGRGRPSSTSRTPLLKAIADAAPTTSINPLYLGDYIFPPHSPLCRGDIECSICCGILFEPIQLPCNNVVCSACCKQWVSLALTVCCPCCHSDHPLTAQTPSNVLLNILGNLLITCTKCSHQVRAGDHTSHLSSGCREHVQYVPIEASSPIPSEERVASTVIKRLLSESDDGATISVSTSGKVHSNSFCKYFNSPL